MLGIVRRVFIAISMRHVGAEAFCDLAFPLMAGVRCVCGYCCSCCAEFCACVKAAVGPALGSAWAIIAVRVLHHCASLDRWVVRGASKSLCGSCWDFEGVLFLSSMLEAVCVLVLLF